VHGLLIVANGLREVDVAIGCPNASGREGCGAGGTVSVCL